jgi:hypothetical protein
MHGGFFFNQRDSRKDRVDARKYKDSNQNADDGKKHLTETSEG